MGATLTESGNVVVVRYNPRPMDSMLQAQNPGRKREKPITSVAAKGLEGIGTVDGRHWAIQSHALGHALHFELIKPII